MQRAARRRRTGSLNYREHIMYEEYYGFIEKPFSLTPDPKYLYRSQNTWQRI